METKKKKKQKNADSKYQNAKVIKILKVNSTVNLENDICIFGFWFSNVKIRAYCIKVSCPRNGRGAHTTG